MKIENILIAPLLKLSLLLPFTKRHFSTDYFVLFWTVNTICSMWIGFQYQKKISSVTTGRKTITKTKIKEKVAKKKGQWTPTQIINYNNWFKACFFIWVSCYLLMVMRGFFQHELIKIKLEIYYKHLFLLFLFPVTSNNVIQCDKRTNKTIWLQC